MGWDGTRSQCMWIDGLGVCRSKDRLEVEGVDGEVYMWREAGIGGCG